MALIHLVLTDDWELRGDGSGDMRSIQFQSVDKLIRIFDAYGVKGSFNAEVMQQISHRKHVRQHPELRQRAEEWDETVEQIYRKGHDVQLHVHPQWLDGRWDGTRWHLGSEWSILRHSREEAEEMIRECKGYLERLLSSVDPSYRCVTFRSGSWCAAPSEFLFPILAAAGIQVDVSIVKGLCYQGVVDLDYRNVEEDFLPYYPDLVDARRIASSPQPIICCPTNSFTFTYMDKQMLHLAKMLRLVGREDIERPNSALLRTAGGASYDKWTGPKTTQRPGVLQRLRKRVESDLLVSDLSGLNMVLFRKMMAVIRCRAKRRGCQVVPVVLENHSKDICDFSIIEKFIAYIARCPDIEVITLKQLAGNLRDGVYPMRMKAERRGN